MTKAITAALTHPETIKTNAIAFGGITLSSLVGGVTDAPYDSVMRSLILATSLLYTVFKSVSAVTEAKRAIAKRKKGRKRRSFLQKILLALKVFLKSIQK